MTEDKDRLYSIEDDDTELYSLDDESMDELPKENIAEEKEPAVSEANVKKHASPIGVLFKTMFTPVEGWKALKRAHFKTDDFAARCFYPLVALAAISEVTMFIYEANVTMADWAMRGLATFVSFFFGYFSVFPVAAFILPSASRPVMKKEIGKQFVMLAMSTLAIFWILIRILPMLEPMLVFLPLWTIYLVFKGIRILRVPKEVENSTTGLLCTMIIGLPLFWNWFMNEILLPVTTR